MYESLSSFPPHPPHLLLFFPLLLSTRWKYEFQMCAFLKKILPLHRSANSPLSKSLLFETPLPFKKIVFFILALWSFFSCVFQFVASGLTVKKKNRLYALFMLFKPLRGCALFRSPTSKSQFTKYIFGSEVQMHKLHSFFSRSGGHFLSSSLLCTQLLAPLKTMCSFFPPFFLWSAPTR